MDVCVILIHTCLWKFSHKAAVCIGTLGQWLGSVDPFRKHERNVTSDHRCTSEDHSHGIETLASQPRRETSHSDILGEVEDSDLGGRRPAVCMIGTRLMS